eukprot:5218653-Prymnesium_polylepis.2
MRCRNLRGTRESSAPPVPGSRAQRRRAAAPPTQSARRGGAKSLAPRSLPASRGTGRHCGQSAVFAGCR